MMKLRKTMFMLVVGLLTASTMLFAGGVSAQPTEAKCEGDVLEAVRAVGLTYIDALNAGDLDPWYELLAEDYEGYFSDSGFVTVDQEGARGSAEGLLAVFPGFQTEIHMSTVSADCRFVTFYWTSSGTFTGPMGDIPPNGKSGAVSGISITEVIAGEITREWVSYDQLTLLGQLGLVTVGAPAEEA